MPLRDNYHEPEGKTENEEDSGGVGTLGRRGGSNEANDGEKEQHGGIEGERGIEGEERWRRGRTIGKRKAIKRAIERKSYTEGDSERERVRD